MNCETFFGTSRRIYQTFIQLYFISRRNFDGTLFTNDRSCLRDGELLDLADLQLSITGRKQTLLLRGRIFRKKNLSTLINRWKIFSN